MAEVNACRAQMVSGVLMCITHGKPLVERSELEATGIRVEQPELDGLFCPQSGRMFSRTTADEFMDEIENG